MRNPTSAANPKFAKPCRKSVANFGFKSGTRIIELASVAVQKSASFLQRVRDADF
jgi:hypothetical protein